MLTIADTGIGIAPHSLQRLGRPFEQVESQLTKTYHGSGLGLAIAQVAHQSAWRIDAAALEARHRHRGLCVAAARCTYRDVEDCRRGLIGVRCVKLSRRDFARNLHQCRNQRRHRVTLRNNKTDAVGDDGIDNRNAPNRIG